MLAIFFLVGLVTGVIAGLLGIGGGLITVPALYFIFSYTGDFAPYTMHIAIATALASTFLTSIGSSLSHYRRGTLLFSPLKWMLPGLIVGCIAGAFLSLKLESTALRITFGLISTLIALAFLAPSLPSFRIAPSPNFTLTLFSIVIGVYSSLLGVGGGIFLVPLLLGYHLPLKNVIALSSVGTMTTAFAASLLYLFLRSGEYHPPQTLGFIEIPAFLIIGISSLLTAPVGVHLAHVLPTPLLKRIFAITLIGTGLSLIFAK